VTLADPPPPYSAYDSETCSIARTLALIGDRWTLLVLRDLSNGVRRFDDLVEHLGIARNVLSRRLGALVDDGLATRTAYRVDGARERQEYRLSQAGRELVPILLAVMAWGDRHLAGNDGPPSVPRHADCGARVRVSLTCDSGHELGDRPRLRLEPGPGSRLREQSTASGAPHKVVQSSGTNRRP
jgi:DNA-binding HxlR family transcriptional regulator